MRSASDPPKPPGSPPEEPDPDEPVPIEDPPHPIQVPRDPPPEPLRAAFSSLRGAQRRSNLTPSLTLIKSASSLRSSQ
jgi:hypothetical protein